MWKEIKYFSYNCFEKEREKKTTEKYFFLCNLLMKTNYFKII